MSGIDVSEYALFNSGSDAPWPDDFIEFVENDKVVIHRGDAVGFYRYKYDGIIVDRDVDAEDLIGMGLARAVSLDICKPWEDSYINFSGDSIILRNFLAPSRGKKNYIISEGGRFYVVNKFYLLASNMATVIDERIYKDVELPPIDYSQKNTPWKEDGIRFVGDRHIEKSTKPGMYVEKHGSITMVRSLASIISMGGAVLEKDAKKTFFPQYCQSEKTKREYKAETVTKDFIEDFLGEDCSIIAKPNFLIKDVNELMSCYHCVKKEIIPSGKEDELYIETVDPEVAEEYQRAVEGYKKFGFKIIELKSKLYTIKDKAMRLINQNNSTVSVFLSSIEYVYWSKDLSSKKQQEYEKFYQRVVTTDAKWETLLVNAGKVKTNIIKADEQFEQFKCELKEIEQTVNSLKSNLKNPSKKGTRKDEARLEEEKSKVNDKSLIEEVRNFIKHIDTQVSSTKTNLFTKINLIEEDRLLLSKRKEVFMGIKDRVSISVGKTGKGKLASLFNKSLKPWNNTIEFTRKDYLIERVEYLTVNFEGIQRKVRYGYKVTIDKGKVEYLFPSALIYVGLAMSK